MASVPATPISGNQSPTSQALTINRNIDAGVTMWAHVNNSPVQIQKRPNPSTLGREITVGLNTFNVSAMPTAPVYQYDVSIFSVGDTVP